jgi:hypothetical protein
MLDEWGRKKKHTVFTFVKNFFRYVEYIYEMHR